MQVDTVGCLWTAPQIACRLQALTTCCALHGTSGTTLDLTMLMRWVPYLPMVLDQAEIEVCEGWGANPRNSIVPLMLYVYNA